MDTQKYQESATQAIWEHNENVAICMPRTEASEETKLTPDLGLLASRTVGK